MYRKHYIYEILYLRNIIFSMYSVLTESVINRNLNTNTSLFSSQSRVNLSDATIDEAIKSVDRYVHTNVYNNSSLNTDERFNFRYVIWDRFVVIVYSRPYFTREYVYDSTKEEIVKDDILPILMNQELDAFAHKMHK